MSDRRFGWAIFFAVFALYLLSSGREPPWGDARGMYDVGEHLLLDGRVDISFPWPEDIPRGRDNRYYGITPLMTALVHVPGLALKEAILAVAPASQRFVKPLTSHLAPAALGALTCALFFGLCRTLGARQRHASLATVILATATTTWVYADYAYSEVLQMAAFTGFFGQLMTTLRTPSKRAGVWLGVWAGIMVNSKYILALAVIGGGLLLILHLRHRRFELRQVLLAALVGGAPFLLLAAGYNYARWGTIAETGYGPYIGRFFGGSTFFGLWGTLLSPNKSAFLYSPPLLLAAAALPMAARRWPRYLVAASVTALPIVVSYASYQFWSGEYAWGPRFFVFAVPVLVAPMVLILERASAWRPVVRWSVITPIVAAGVAVQLLGTAFYWDHYIRIAKQAREQWLGQPDRSGAIIAERGRGHCDSCFEDMHGVMWLPPFNPIKGHWWLLKSTASGDNWKAAEAAAPWHRYTALPVDIHATYARVRLDWWGLLWLRDFRQYRAAGIVLLVLLLLVVATTAAVWIRLHRASEPSTPRL